MTGFVRLVHPSHQSFSKAAKEISRVLMSVPVVMKVKKGSTTTTTVIKVLEMLPQLLRSNFVSFVSLGPKRFKGECLRTSTTVIVIVCIRGNYVLQILL